LRSGAPRVQREKSEPRTGEDSTPKSNGAPPEFGETPIEDDIQLQKAIELLKTWKIFKDLRPL
jgi:carboxyl-terminal processing protease